MESAYLHANLSAYTLNDVMNVELYNISITYC